MKKFLSFISISILAACALSSCSDYSNSEPNPIIPDRLPPDMPNLPFPLITSKDGTAGTSREYECYFSAKDEGFPVYYMTARDVRQFMKFIDIKGVEAKYLFRTINQYSADGYAEAPNDINYIYTYDWVKFSTEKHKESKTLYVRYAAEPNPYNQYRYMAVGTASKSYQKVFFIIQEPNPDGIDPPKDGLTYSDILWY